MNINDLLSILLIFFSLYMTGRAIHIHDPRGVIWVIVALLNAFALYLSKKRQAREQAKNQESIDVEYEDVTDPLAHEEASNEIEVERLDEEDAQDEFDEEDL